MNIRYRVELSQTERAGLIALLAGGKHAVRKLNFHVGHHVSPTVGVSDVSAFETA